MIRTMTNFAHRRGIISDARGWNVRSRATSIKFISISSQLIKKMTCFINIFSTKNPML